MSFTVLLFLVVGGITRVVARQTLDIAQYVAGSVLMIVGLVVCTILAVLMSNVIVAVAGLLFTVITIISTRHELKKLRAVALKAKEGQK